VFEAVDGDPACRASVLVFKGKTFCARADFNRQSESDEFLSGGPKRPVRLFAYEKPVVTAIQGAAIGGGLGLALVADFRVVSAEVRFCGEFREARNSSGIRLDAHFDAAKAAIEHYTQPRRGPFGDTPTLPAVEAQAVSQRSGPLRMCGSGLDQGACRRIVRIQHTAIDQSEVMCVGIARPRAQHAVLESHNRSVRALELLKKKGKLRQTRLPEELLQHLFNAGRGVFYV